MKKFIPGVHPTYKQQFDKLTEAYIKGEVNPYNVCGCFVGNLLNKTGEWNRAKIDILISIERVLSKPTCEQIARSLQSIEDESNGLYSAEDILYIEKRFMANIYGYGGFNNWKIPTPMMEEDLFRAFQIALEDLKRVHISYGEIIEEEFYFKKRELTFS